MARTKKQPTELEIKLRNEYMRLHPNDVKWVDWLVKDKDIIKELSDGSLFVISKPHLETSFYFGYSDCGQGRSFDDNNDIMDEVDKSIEEYFVNRNTQSILDMVKKLMDETNTFYKRKTYYNESNIVDVYTEHDWDHCNKDEVLSAEDRKIVVDAYMDEFKKTMKRCQSYLKRFGAKKLSVHSYWIDR